MSQPVAPLAPPAPPAGDERPPQQPQAPTEELPRRFGKYTLLRSLARGGMAEIFLAIQKSVAGFEKLIVIKRILPAMNQDKAFIEMLLHEARVAATMSHPNIVQTFDVGAIEGLYFIAMEHVHGEDIRSIVRQMKKKGVGDFPLEHAIGIVLGMCAGLAYAHEKRDLQGSPLGIVHRDISPQNVVVTFTGDVKIVDFGVAKSESKGQESTKSGKLKGKVPYMSPEQARGENIDARSDVFATGVMLFELTTGKRLFKGASEYETLKLICERDYPLPSQVRPGYAPALERIVMKALAKDKAERYQTARDMQADLEAFVREQRLTVSTINLMQFMESLFEEKLASQKEELLQGKQLADIIEAQQPFDPNDLSHAGFTALGTQALAPAPPPSKVPLVAAIVLGMLLAAGVGGFFLYKKREEKAASDRAAAAARDLAAARAQRERETKGTIEVTSDPPGASVWIDGDLRPDPTPATIKQLPASGKPIEVKITKDGFEAARQVVTLTDGAPLGKVNVVMKKGSVVIDVTVTPADAKPTISLDGKKAEGLTIDSISSGDQHKLVVSAAGYSDFTTSFIGTPQEKKHFDVKLEKFVGTGPAKTDTGPRGNGKLNVGASGGWCNVAIDGIPKGPTPLAGIELSSGSHRVTCTPGDGAPSKSETVNVPVDGTARLKFTL